MGLQSFDFETFANTIPAGELAYVNSASIGVGWSDLEPEKGQFAWEKLDSLVSALESHHVGNILFTLDKYVPEWAGPEYGPPTDVQDWADFSRAVAQRYKGRITYYQVWNEPGWDKDSESQQKYGIISFGGNVETDYQPMLQASYEAIKQVDPAAVVIAGSMGHDTSGDPEKGAGLYGVMVSGPNHIQDYCDAIAIHPYYNPPDWARFALKVREVLRSAGVNKELVVTEIGWLHNIDNGLEVQREAIGMQGLGSLIQQGFTKFWIYKDIDDPPGQAWDGFYDGLYDYQGNPHPAWNSFKAWVLAFKFFNLPFPPV